MTMTGGNDSKQDKGTVTAEVATSSPTAGTTGGASCATNTGSTSETTTETRDVTEASGSPSEGQDAEADMVFPKQQQQQQTLQTMEDKVLAKVAAEDATTRTGSSGSRRVAPQQKQKEQPNSADTEKRTSVTTTSTTTGSGSGSRPSTEKSRFTADSMASAARQMSSLEDQVAAKIASVNGSHSSKPKVTTTVAAAPHVGSHAVASVVDLEQQLLSSKMAAMGGGAGVVSNKNGSEKTTGSHSHSVGRDPEGQLASLEGQVLSKMAAVSGGTTGTSTTNPGLASNSSNSEVVESLRRLEQEALGSKGLPSSVADSRAAQAMIEISQILKEEDQRNSQLGSPPPRQPSSTADHAEPRLGAVAVDGPAPFHDTEHSLDRSGTHNVVTGSGSESNANNEAFARSLANQEAGQSHSHSQALGILTVAEPVQEGDEPNIPQAETEEEHLERLQNQRQRKQRTSFIRVSIVTAVAILVLVGLAVVLPVLLLSKGDSTSISTPTNDTLDDDVLDPVPPQELSPKQLMEDLLPQNTLEVIREDPRPPQYYAFHWMLGDPMFLKYSDARKVQRFALATLYYATDGANWVNKDNWMRYTVHECEWYYNGNYTEIIDTNNYAYTGIVEQHPRPCGGGGNLSQGKSYDDYNQEYQHVLLEGNRLVGTVPPELFLIPGLKQVVLSRNALVGSVPTEVGKLQDLERLDLFNNELTGVLPTELGNLSNLHFLGLLGNALKGPLVSELGKLASLEVLYLETNKFTGTIPSEFNNLRNLRKLFLNINELTGTIPADWDGNFPELYELAFDSNKLTGTIPSWVSKVSNLVIMSFHTNKFNSTIPTWLNGANFPNVLFVWFHANSLTGTLPNELGTLTSLKRFWAWGNKLTGTLPSELGLLHHMWDWQVDTNALTGTIPTELGTMIGLKDLWLNGNAFTGTIPSELGALTTNFRVACLQENALTGTIPTQLGLIGQESNANFLYLGPNMLTGPIPSEIGLHGGRLLEIKFPYNDLSGTVPTELVSLVNMTMFNVSNNPRLSGTIPDLFCRIGEIQKEDDYYRLDFDCSSTLCGCECNCSESNHSNETNSTL